MQEEVRASTRICDVRICGTYQKCILCASSCHKFSLTMPVMQTKSSIVVDFKGIYHLQECLFAYL